MDATFRTSIPEPKAEESIPLPDPKPNVVGAKEFTESELEPLNFSGESDSEQILLKELGIEDSLRNLAEEDVENLKFSKQYVLDVLKARGYTPTVGAFKKVFSEIKDKLGMNEFSDPNIVLKRIGVLAKAWESLGFIKNPSKRKMAFDKVASIQDSNEVERELFKQMEQERVWE